MQQAFMKIVLLTVTLTVVAMLSACDTSEPSIESTDISLDGAETIATSMSEEFMDSNHGQPVGGEGGEIMIVENICHIADPAIDTAMENRGPFFLPIVSEIHAGLTKIREGSAVLELADRYSVSDNGLS